MRSYNVIDHGLRTLVIEKNNNHIFEDNKGSNYEGRFSQMMSVKTTNSLENHGLKTEIKEEAQILGFLGIINIIGCNYMALITEADTVGELYRAKIYKIAQV